MLKAVELQKDMYKKDGNIQNLMGKLRNLTALYHSMERYEKVVEVEQEIDHYLNSCEYMGHHFFCEKLLQCSSGKGRDQIMANVMTDKLFTY